MHFSKSYRKLLSMDKSCCADIYEKSIEVLTSQGKFYINLGLERVQAALEILGNPQNNLKFIHVAGTNGKGSVCSMLSAILKDAKMQRCKVAKCHCEEGVNDLALVKERLCHCEERSDEAIQKESYSPIHPFTHSPLKVGLFVSPHIYEYTERIKINDVEISQDDFAKNVLEVIELAEKNNIHLTEFEIITVVAFKYFAENEVDIVILETGLGGRLDATNVIENNICSVITHIDFDHTERLGGTIEKIATEKAGIIKQNCPVVTSKNNAGFEIIQKVANKLNSKLFFAEEQAYSTIHLFTHSPLKGTYQRENFSLVLKVIELLNQNGFEISAENIETGLENVKHPCRFEYLNDKNIIIDGAHNPNGTKVLRESLDEYFPNQKIKFVFGCLRNKDYAQMMENLFTQNDEIYFYEFDNLNACSYAELASACRFASKPLGEFKQDSSILTVICGSFYMIKELMLKIDIK